MIDLITCNKDSSKLKEWIKILNANPGSAKINNNRIFMQSEVFMKLIGLEAQVLQQMEAIKFIQFQREYISKYEYVQLNY